MGEGGNKKSTGRRGRSSGHRAQGAGEEAQSTEHRAQGRRMVHGVRYAETKRWQKG
jgi:hypothetical protein